MRYPWRGARFVYVDHPQLARLWVPPVVITFALLIAAFWFALDVREDVANWLWIAPTGGDWLAGAARVARRVLGWLIAVVLLGIATVTVALFSSVIAAPFNDALSESVESVYLGRPTPRFALRRALRDVVRTVGLEALKLLVYASVMLPLLGISWLVPAAGPVLQTVFSFAITALFFAVDHVDWAASRRDLSARQRVRWAFSHLRPMLGLGTGVWLLLLVPIVNLLFMPAAVAGGTLLFLDLEPGEPETPPPART